MTYPKSLEPILRYRNASVSLAGGTNGNDLVSNVDLEVFSGEIVALVGESGSGKTMTALSMLGLLPKGAQFSADVATINGTDITRLSSRGWRDFRGANVGIVFQEPLTALNPLLTVGEQIGEVLFHKLGMSRNQRRERAADLIDAMGIADPLPTLSKYPHQLSGGMRQRVMLAIAMAGEPSLLIADEPTTALDNLVQNQVLELIVDTAARAQVGVLFITHDLSIVAQIADRVAVMKSGRLLESASVDQLFTAPADRYTQRLVNLAPRIPEVTRRHFKLAASPRRPAEKDRSPPGSAEKETPLLDIRHVVKTYDLPSTNPFRPIRARALDDVSIRIRPGRTLGLVGQSGSGKSSLARIITGLASADTGEIIFDGNRLDLSAKRKHATPGRDIQMVFQDPYSSLNPRLRISDIITEPRSAQGWPKGAKPLEEAAALLEAVGLSPDMARRYPHQLSGGQRQRIGIARALSTRPRLLICDEPVSALDVSVQAEILDLLKRLQPEYGLTYLFIAHGLDSIYSISHDIAVMHQGRVVEHGERDEVFGNPRHPYTQALLDSMLDSDPRSTRFRQRIPAARFAAG